MSFWDAWFLWRDALLAAVLTAVLLSYLSLFVVLTRSAFASAAIAQFAAFGVVLALLWGGASEDSLLPAWAGMGAGALGGPIFFSRRVRGRTPPDARLATFIVGAQAATLLGARFLGRAYRHVQSALFGDAVVASKGELYLLLVVALLVASLHFVCKDRFLLVIFDPDGARAQGMRVRLWGAVLGLTVGISIATATRGVGGMPSFAFSVVPAATGLAVARRLRGTLWVGWGLAIAASAGGYYLSFVYDLPTGPTMVGVLLALGGGCLLVVRLLGRAGGLQREVTRP